MVIPVVVRVISVVMISVRARLTLVMLLVIALVMIAVLVIGTLARFRVLLAIRSGMLTVIHVVLV